MRKSWLGKGGVLVTTLLLAACSDLGDLATLPSRTNPADLPSHRAAGAAVEYDAAVVAAAAVARAAVVEQNLPGLSVAVAVDGVPVWAEGFGWANLESGTGITPDTRFRVGGIARAFTAAAAGLLAARGVLDLDAPVQDHVDFPAQIAPITTRHLLANAAGIRDLQGERETLRRTGCVTEAARLEPFAGDRLRFEPGTAVRSSTFGFVLAGAVVSGAAGEPYLDFVRRAVLAPLGMTDTDAEVAGRVVADGASPYHPIMFEDTRRGLETTDPVDLSCTLAAGGFVSTPSDLVRFGIGWSTGDLLDAATVAAFETPLVLADGRPADALGWRVGALSGDAGDAGIRVVSQEGNAFGGSATLLILPDHDVIVAVASNVTAADTRAVATAIARLFLAAGPGDPS